jgi:hypothetical protein
MKESGKQENRKRQNGEVLELAMQGLGRATTPAGTVSAVLEGLDCPLYLVVRNGCAGWAGKMAHQENLRGREDAAQVFRRTPGG